MVPTMSTNVGAMSTTAPTMTPQMLRFDAKTVQNKLATHLLDCNVQAVAQQAVMNASGKTATAITETKTETRPPQTPQDLNKPVSLSNILEPLGIMGAALLVCYGLCKIVDIPTQNRIKQLRKEHENQA